jgi:hypothetical protein
MCKRLTHCCSPKRNLMLFLTDGFWQCQMLDAVTSARRAPEMRVSLSSRRTSPLVLIERKAIERFTSMRRSPWLKTIQPKPADFRAFSHRSRPASTRSR